MMGPEKDVDQKPAEPAVGEKAATALDNQERAAAPDATATAADVTEDKAAKKETDKAPNPEANEIKMEDVATPKSNGSSDQAAASENRRRGSRQNGESGEAQRTPRTPKKRKPRRDQNGHSQSEPESTDREGGSRPPGGQRRQRDRSDGRPRVDMDESIPESHRYVWADDVYKRSLYVGNMSAHVTKDEVRALSEAIRSVRFVNRRSAFLDFESPEVASAQMEVLRAMELKGQPLQVEPSRPRGATTAKSDRMLYVRGIPDEQGMDKLGPLFPSALLIDRREGKVLLRFKDHESAIAAINEAIAQGADDCKFSFAAARPRWNRRNTPRPMYRRPGAKFIKQETRQD
ncbi:unnamed protein product [Ixodes pacificus]